MWIFILDDLQQRPGKYEDMPLLWCGGCGYNHGAPNGAFSHPHPTPPLCASGSRDAAHFKRFARFGYGPFASPQAHNATAPARADASVRPKSSPADGR
jgi:hypothetical protein